MGLHLQLVSELVRERCCIRLTGFVLSIKKLRASEKYVMPDRTAVTMTVPFMEAYVKLLIQTCHKYVTSLSEGPPFLTHDRAGERSLPWVACLPRSPSRTMKLQTRPP